MSSELPAAVDQYVTHLLVKEDAALTQSLQDSAAAELPAIAVAPPQGKFLHLLARSMRARRILEIGTLGGYSTIWLARALPADGRLITLEFEPRHAQVAGQNLRRAGVAEKVEIRIGAAADTLQQLIAEKQPPFDLIFIDADKESYPQYLELSLALSRPGTTLIADNIVREGELINPDSTDPRVHGVREFCQKLSKHPRLNSTVLQTVGSKGYDGFAMAIVEEDVAGATGS